MEHDPVNHPSHYTAGHRIEVIEFLEDWMLPFHLANCVKYICRAGWKDPARTIEDLEKGRWYLNRYIAAEERRRCGMNAYLYFCWICVAIALGMILACAVDYCIESNRHGKHELRRKRGAK